jgi:hypothetical protein
MSDRSARVRVIVRQLVWASIGGWVVAGVLWPILLLSGFSSRQAASRACVVVGVLAGIVGLFSTSAAGFSGPGGGDTRNVRSSRWGSEASSQQGSSDPIDGTLTLTAQLLVACLELVGVGVALWR